MGNIHVWDMFPSPFMHASEREIILCVGPLWPKVCHQTNKLLNDYPGWTGDEGHRTHVFLYSVHSWHRQFGMSLFYSINQFSDIHRWYLSIWSFKAPKLWIGSLPLILVIICCVNHFHRFPSLISLSWKICTSCIFKHR